MSETPGEDFRSLYLKTAAQLLRDSGTRGAAVSGLGASPTAGTDIDDIPEVSARFRTKLAGGLQSRDPRTRSLISSQLLAKALTDLQMGARLLGAGEARTPLVGQDRGMDLTDLEDSLSILFQEGPGGYRSLRRPAVLIDLVGARERLNSAVSASLKTVLRDTEQVVRSAFTGLLGLSLTQVAAAATEVTTGISNLLASPRGIDQVELSGRQLLIESAHSATSLMEQPVLESAVRQVLGWLEEIRGGRIVSSLLEQAYLTELTGKDLRVLVESASGPLEPFSKALQALDDLSGEYRRQARISGRILQGARWIGGGLTIGFPQASLLMGVLYVTIGGYSILSGADYVDSPRLKLIKRVPGVRLSVEEHFPPPTDH